MLILYDGFCSDIRKALDSKEYLQNQATLYYETGSYYLCAASRIAECGHLCKHTWYRDNECCSCRGLTGGFCILCNVRMRMQEKAEL